MGEKQETIADIVAEMRIFKCRNLETGELEECNAIAKYFGNRIEAAHKREQGNAVKMPHFDHAVLDVKVGNGAKMHEALVNISKYADCAAMRQHDATTQHYIDQIRKWAEAALAEPLRNCDKFGTDNVDALLEYEDVCEKSETEESVADAFSWLFSLADNTKGGTK